MLNLKLKQSLSLALLLFITTSLCGFITPENYQNIKSRLQAVTNSYSSEMAQDAMYGRAGRAMQRLGHLSTISYWLDKKIHDLFFRAFDQSGQMIGEDKIKKEKNFILFLAMCFFDKSFFNENLGEAFNTDLLKYYDFNDNRQLWKVEILHIAYWLVQRGGDIQKSPDTFNLVLALLLHCLRIDLIPREVQFHNSVSNNIDINYFRNLGASLNSEEALYDYLLTHQVVPALSTHSAMFPPSGLAGFDPNSPSSLANPDLFSFLDLLTRQSLSIGLVAPVYEELNRALGVENPENLIPMISNAEARAAYQRDIEKLRDTAMRLGRRRDSVDTQRSSESN